MFTTKKFLASLLIAASAAMVSGATWAASGLALGAGGSINGTDTGFSVSEDFLSSGSQVALVSSDFDNGAGVSGTLTSGVFSGLASDPLGGFTFAYILHASGVPIKRWDINGFTSSLGSVFDIRIAYSDQGGFVVPIGVSRSLDGNTLSVSFDDGIGLAAQDSSGADLYANLIVYTSTTDWRAGDASVAGFDTQSGEEALASTLSPIPEPETYAFLLAGLGMLGVVARNRKAQKA